MNDLTLIIPAKREVESLPIFLKEIETYKCKKLIVLQKEDIETKKSIENIQNIEIHEQNNNGYGNALIEGINSVKTKYCCIINADGSMDPKYLKQMIETCRELDFVFGSRYQKNAKSHDDTIITLLGNFFFTKFGQIFFGLPITDILYTFVLGKTAKAKKLKLIEKNFAFCVELPIKAVRQNMSIGSSSAVEFKRIDSEKKVNEFRDGLKILYSMIKLLFKNA